MAKVAACHLTRRFELTEDGAIVEKDSRLGPAGQTIAIALPRAAREETARYRVLYERVRHRSPSDPARAPINGTVLIAEGRLDP